jgi:hypothetical protein
MKTRNVFRFVLPILIVLGLHGGTCLGAPAFDIVDARDSTEQSSECPDRSEDPCGKDVVHAANATWRTLELVGAILGVVAVLAIFARGGPD